MHTKCDASESNQVGNIDEVAFQIENKTSSAIQVISEPAIPAKLLLFFFFSFSFSFSFFFSELTLQSHLRGKRHRAEAKLWCTLCNLRCSGEIDMIAHLKGKRHLKFC
ncbi:hypothetical protein K7X08_008991 [Anisodus acutangulus]|uniref:C2H2-type domain-containing protein n=1 Tax=Anisodus acutangulus TaxID=402998 RepID=A0A9Q1RQD6_9SOLA|nr:hypothetical protein K7X08_008991 [Anisodus acutangulus]